jgi:hypothetical protein
MKKITLTLFLFIGVITARLSAQNVGINTDGSSPDSKAMLDVKATGSGFLMPRMAWASRPTGLTSTQNGLIIYSTDGDGTNGAGFYYYKDPNWLPLMDNKKAWNILGNSGTTASSAAYGSAVNNNFIGTTDNNSLVFATNNLERMRVTNSGNIGIGLSSPSEKLDVSGNIKFSGALMPNNNAGTSGQILQSNGSGSPPTWSNYGQAITKVNSSSLTQLLSNNTGTYSNTSGGRGWAIGTWQDLSGSTITRTVPSGSLIYLNFYIDVIFDDINFYGANYIVFRIVKDGSTELGRAGTMFMPGYYFTYNNCSISVYDSSSDGLSHTWKVQYYISNTESSFTESVYVESRALNLIEIKQ